MGKSLGAGEIHYGDSPIETRLAKSLSYHGLLLREQTPSFASVAGERLVAYRTFTVELWIQHLIRSLRAQPAPGERLRETDSGPDRV